MDSLTEATAAASRSERVHVRPTLVAVIEPCINFATHQAAIPLVRELRVSNPPESSTYTGLRIELVCDPAVILPQTWHVSRLSPGDDIAVTKRDVQLDGGMLDRLSERMRADVSIRLLDGDTILDEVRVGLDALARHEWGGTSMPELLAAFILPNDPAVAQLLAEASDLLRAGGRRHSFEGYQSGKRERPWEMASAIWSAVARRRVVYSEPPRSFERSGQKIRTPLEISEHRLATCLDTAVLFASALELAGLNAVVCLVKGHALVGVWLVDATLPELITDDASLLRRYVALQDLVLFETTVVTSNPPAPFPRAIDAGARLIREEVEGDFVLGLDLRQARDRGILPLPSLLREGEVKAQGVRGEIDLPLDLPPTLRPVEEVPATEPSSAEGRIDLWKRRLLDLTKRNRLLNLKASKTAIRLVCPDIALVEDKLADDHKLAIIPLERLTSAEGARDAAVFEQQQKVDYTEQFARRALERDQLVADLPKPELQAGLVELYRKAASDLREGGANTLFLAIGSLRWRPLDVADGKFYRAPILLIPVTLERASAATAPKLRRHSDDTVLNMTLLEMLRSDFEIVIPELMGPLPTDSAGVNVVEIVRLIRKAIGDARGWSVEDDVVLSTFSFAKYLMWKDLCDRTDALKKSRFVEHMIDTPRERYGRNAEVLAPNDIDARIDPRDLFAPLQADSSQVAAIHASGADGDLVLEGPPGTGKSQTIANIIAHNMALGRRVLFVAEKMTALSVVHDRLRRIGLGDFCLELHSNKATRRNVVDQLDGAWRARESRTATEWEAESARLKVMRERLNGLVKALHAPASSGVSARQAIAEASASTFDASVSLDWPRDLAADRARSSEDLAALTELSTRLGEAYREVLPEDAATFAPIAHGEWSFEWAAALSAAARSMLERLDELEGLTPRVERILGLSALHTTSSTLKALADAASAVTGAAGVELAAFLGPDGERLAQELEQGLAVLEKYRRSHASLPYPVSHELVASVDHEALLRDWQAASDSFVLVRAFRRRSVRKRAEGAWGVRGVADVGPLARALVALKGQIAALRRCESAIPAHIGWRGLDTSATKLRATVEIGRKLRGALARLVSEGGDLGTVRSRMASFILEQLDRVAAGTPDGELLRRFIDIQLTSTEAIADFARHSALRDAEGLRLDQARALARGVVDRTARLNPWCRWQKMRAEAEAAGLKPLATALEAGVLDPRQTARAFRVAYCRWLAPLLIDARPELRAFSSVEHERLISEFRALDEALARMAAAEIRARLSRDVPRRAEATPIRGYGVLAREVQVKRSSRSVRTVLSELGPVLGRLAPCLMMSPMSVAQFIPADAEQADLVIFDEASQITTWDAIGAIARGRNVLIVGDPKQMPPTNYFNRSADDDESAEHESEDAVADLESILDEALATGMRHHRLTGHYRSRHESLIAFSNHAYYGGDLVTYPAAETRTSAVSLVRVNGSYQKGKDRTNPTEAKAVVAAISRRLRDPATRHQSIGVVTMNSEQQRLIRNLLDDERRAYPEIEPAFKGPDGEEEDMVYNLETVQGHERDVIFVSVGYGPAEPGGRAMSMNFGPLNRSGGERRLNVAITRAAEETVLFASFGPEMIDLTRTKARAVEDLKHYMEFAEQGPAALRRATHAGLGADRFDSPFEEAVARALRARGWDVRTQVGVSRFYIDLGIVHPDAPGRFLAGVECDGATYHGSATARDRDRIRHAVLSSLGWNLLRLWSTDYFLDPVASMDRVDQRLKSLLEQDRATRSSPSHRGPGSAGAPHSEASDSPAPVTPPEAGTVPSTSEALGREDIGAPELTAAEGDSRFYDDAHLSTLRAQCLAFVDRAGPMHLSYLAERIARSYGFARTGKVIRERVWTALGKARQLSQEADGTQIVWPAATEPAPVLRYRGTEIEGEPRPWDATPYPEKLGLAIDIVRAHGVSGGIAVMAAAIGIGRIREGRRKELELLLREAQSRTAP